MAECSVSSTNLEIRQPVPPGCSVDSLRRLATDSAVPFAKLSNGELPNEAPSLESLTMECRVQEFDRWFDLVLDDPAMNSEAARILEGQREEMRQSFEDGDTKQFLKQATIPLITPVIDDAITDIRRDLQRDDRLDLLDQLAENSEDMSRRDIDEQAESIRGVVSAANGQGKIIALLLVVVGCVLLVAVHFPRPGDMLRWPGVSLLLSGGACLAVGIVVNSAVPGQIREALDSPLSYSSDIPVAAISLAGDLGEAFARQVTAGFVPAAVTVMVVGGVLVVASFFAGVLWASIRRVLPLPDDDSQR